MKRYMIPTILLCGLLAQGASAGFFGEWGDDEEQIDIRDLPAVIVQTVMRVFPQGEIKKAEKDTEHKRVVFDVAVAAEGALYSIEMGTDGKLIKVELEDDHGDKDEALPDAVQAAVMKVFPKGHIKDVDRDKEKTQVLYTVKVRDGDVEHVVVANEQGKVLKIAKDTERERDEIDNDDEHEGEDKDRD